MRHLLFIACFILIGSPAGAVITKVQDGATVVLGTGPTVTLGTNVVGGDMLAACIHTGSTVTSVTDTQSNMWNAANPPGGGAGMAVYWVQAANAGATTVTVTCSSGAAFCGFTVAEFSGMGSAPTQDGLWVQSSYGTAPTIQTNTLTTGGANPELVFGCGFTDSVQTPSGLVDYGAGAARPSPFPIRHRPRAEEARRWSGPFNPPRRRALSAFNGRFPVHPPWAPSRHSLPTTPPLHSSRYARRAVE